MSMMKQKTPLEKLISERLKKLEGLKKVGIEPFGYRFERTHRIKDIIDKFSTIKTGEKLENKKVKIAGRIRAIRIHGKAGFADIEDMSGRIQTYIKIDSVGKKMYNIFEKLLDVGDFLGIEGFIFKTKKGELSIWVEKFEVLSKALRPLPSEWFGLKDVEIRYRQRYLDLLMNPKVKKTFLVRSKIIDAMREFLKNKGFVEVETPVLQPIPGGAAARPFITYHNALGINLYLRIAPELYLKRLIVGGFEKVFEICTNFRNEGIDRRHNPEFTMMEFYWAYADYKDNMKLTEEMITYIVKKVLGKLKVTYQGKKIDFTPPWKRITMMDAIKEYVGIDIKDKPKDELLKISKQKGLDIDETVSKGEIIGTLFEELVEKKLIQPTFVFDHPVEVCPLAKRKRDDPSLIERFEVFVGGLEIVNAYTELNDPIDQKDRFIEQAEKRAKGDEEAHMMDEDFITALEYGMPPTTGNGVGIDRLVMLLTDSPSIRDVILFPTLKPEKETRLFGDEIRDDTIRKRG